MAAMGEDEETRKWWGETDPCQIILEGRKEGAKWCDLEMLFFME